MLSRALSLVALACLPALGLAADKPTPIKPIKSFKGRIDKDQHKESPTDGVITNAKDLEKLCKAWKIKDDKGDVRVLSLATRDIRDDFAYNVLVISRTGVKTINGKEIPK